MSFFLSFIYSLFIYYLLIYFYWVFFIYISNIIPFPGFLSIDQPEYSKYIGEFQQQTTELTSNLIGSNE